MAYDGFTLSEGDALTWIVYHDHGSTTVRAKTAEIALARFMAKYPNYSVIDVKRC